MASEYLKWKYRDVKPEEPVVLTGKQKAANWWYYHKWWLLAGCILLAAGGNILWNALGIGKVKPDYQAAFVAAAPLDEKTLKALEEAFAALGEDCSGDGRKVVQIHSYVDMSAAGTEDTSRYAAAASVRLMADLDACESYFFICDDCETLHKNYEILAAADGSLAEGKTESYCVPLESCPALAAAGDLSGLYLARRGFYQDRVCRYKEQCDALWEKLTEGAQP